MLLLIVFLVACANDDLGENETGNQEVEESKENLQEAWEQSQETEKELYITMLNMLIDEYDEQHDLFDTEKGVDIYELIVNHPKGIEVARDTKDGIIGIMSEDEQIVYGEFYDKVIELEETFSHIDWSD